MDGFAVPVGIAAHGHPLKAPALDFARSFDPRTHDGARLSQPVVGQLLIFDRRHFDMDVDPEGRLRSPKGTHSGGRLCRACGPSAAC